MLTYLFIFRHRIFTVKFISSAAVIIAIIFIVGWSLNFITAPKKADSAPFPFADGECLVYLFPLPRTSEPIVRDEVCFNKLKNGSFTEKRANFKTTFDKNGFSRLTDEEIALWKKNLNAYSDRFFELAARDLHFHNHYYGPPELSPGTIFYNGYPVKKLSEFNGNKVYVVEENPSIDTKIAGGGIVSKSFWRLSGKLFPSIIATLERKQGNKELIKRLYYNYKTGVLEGNETFIIERDGAGRIISFSLSPEEGYSKTILAERKIK